MSNLIQGPKSFLFGAESFELQKLFEKYFLYLSTGDDLRLGELETVVAGVSEFCGEGVPGAEGIVVFILYVVNFTMYSIV